jgi:hypothetical protein
MLVHSAPSSADPAVAWSLLSRPARWHEWAPHVRGGWGLGAPEVREGARGAARLLGVVPVPVAITDVQEGRSWTWRVAGVVDMEHRVDPRVGGCLVTVTIVAPGPLQPLLAATYGPLVALLVRRLARVAAATAA